MSAGSGVEWSYRVYIDQLEAAIEVKRMNRVLLGWSKAQKRWWRLLKGQNTAKKKVEPHLVLF